VPSCDQGALIRRVVGHLVLEHDRGTVLAVPDDLVALVVFNKQTVGSDIVPVYDQVVRSGVVRPAHTGAVIRSPSPDIVDDHVVPVDLEADGSSARSSAADPEKDVLDQRRIVRVASGTSQDG
jgi:hypothetical protein